MRKGQIKMQLAMNIRMKDEKESTYEKKDKSNTISNSVAGTTYANSIMQYYNIILNNSITILTQSMCLRGSDTSS